MSNCVEFVTPRIYFTPSEIDVPSLLSEVEKHKDHDPYPGREIPSMTCGTTPDEKWNCQAFFWFLTPGNVLWKMGRTTADNLLTVNLGHGKSSHTWRDLESTLMALNKFVTVDKEFALRGRDEFDGFKNTIAIRVRFGKDVKPGEHSKL